MKPKILTILIIVFCFGFFTKCGIVDNDDDYFNGTMQTKVNNELIIFDEAFGDRVLGDDMNWSGITKIVGITNMDISGYEIQLDFPYNPVKGKTYHPRCMYRTWIGNYYDYNLRAYITKDINPPSSESSSTVTFTSITNNRYIGKFTFTAYDNPQNPNDSIVVSNGTFEIDRDGKKW